MLQNIHWKLNWLGYGALVKSHNWQHYKVIQHFLHFVIVALIAQNQINNQHRQQFLDLCLN